MSGVGFYMRTPEVASITSAKTLLGVSAAANHRVHITEVGVWFKGTTVTNEPVTVELIRFAADGTGTSGTVVKTDETDDETFEVSFKHTYTVEPATPTVLKFWYIHPQSGVLQMLPIERPIEIKGGGFWGVRATADDSVTGGVSLEGNE
jgi:hypothetical protein